jgi:hypothetical protein
MAGRFSQRRRDAGATKGLRGMNQFSLFTRMNLQHSSVAYQVQIRKVSSSFYNSSWVSMAQ